MADDVETPPWVFILRQLEHVWTDAELVPLWWDKYRENYASVNSRHTYGLLFDNSIVQRLHSLLQISRRVVSQKSLRRWHGPFDPGLVLPKDIMVRPVAEGVVAISASNGCVLKAGNKGWRKKGIETEIKSYAAVKAAGIEAHVPRILEDGKIKSGGYWIASEFVPNTRPLTIKMGRKAWQQWLRYECLPTMEPFYEEEGVQKHTTDELLDEQLEWIEANGVPEPLLALSHKAREARPAGGGSVLHTAKIHGDIWPPNVHRDKHNWWLLDWERTYRHEILYEALHWYFGDPTQHKDKEVLWAWLQGETSHSGLPRRVRDDLELFMDWHNTWLDAHIDSESLRYQMLVCLVRDIRNRVKATNSILRVTGGTELCDLFDHPDYLVALTARQFSLLQD